MSPVGQQSAVYGGLWAAAVEGLAGALIVRCCGAPKLTAAARGGRGRRRGAHRGQSRAARWRGCAGGVEDQSSAAVLGVEQVEARRSETRSGMSCGVVL
jgi:hypothetical protein